jgi:hypothetical protein
MFSKANKVAATMILILALFGGSKAAAQTPAEAQFRTDVQNDAVSITNFMNKPFAQGLGFFSTLGWNTPPTVFDFKAGPHFEIGVGVGADLISIPDLSTLNLPGFQGTSGLDLPSMLPIPYPVGTIRVGLMNGLDAGFRLSIIPQINLPRDLIGIDFGANYTSWGIDLRCKILDDKLLPNVALGMSFDMMTGKISIGTDLDISESYSGSTGTIRGTSTYELNWNLKSLGARVMVGKDLKIIYPYASVGFQRHSGTVSSSMTGALTGNISAPAGSGTDFPIVINALTEDQPVFFEPKFVVGIDAGEGFHVSAVGESNGIDLAANLNFRVQF